MTDQSMKHKNPDRGPPMHTGAHQFNKGYTSDDEYFNPKYEYPGDKQRGNDYMSMQNEVCRGDSKKLERSKFSRIA